MPLGLDLPQCRAAGGDVANHSDNPLDINSDTLLVDGAPDLCFLVLLEPNEADPVDQQLGEGAERE